MADFLTAHPTIFLWVSLIIVVGAWLIGLHLLKVLGTLAGIAVLVPFAIDVYDMSSGEILTPRGTWQVFLSWLAILVTVILFLFINFWALKRRPKAPIVKLLEKCSTLLGLLINKLRKQKAN